MKGQLFTKAFSRYISVIMAIAIIFSCFAMLTVSAAETADAKADLIVTEVYSVEETVYDGDSVRLYAVIRNNGTADAVNPLVNFAAIGQNVDAVRYNGTIRAGEQKTVISTKEWEAFWGTSKLMARVNSDKAIDEKNYNNNICAQLIPVVDSSDDKPPVTTEAPTTELTTKAATVYTLDAYKADLNGAVKSNSEEGYTGDGYAELNNRNNSVEFTFDAPEAGEYKITVYHANGSEQDRNARIAVNGSDVNDITVNKSYTHGISYWDSWLTSEVTVNLNKGVNKITVTNISDGKFYIDAISLYKPYSKKISSFSFLKSLNPSLSGDIECEIDDMGGITAKVASDTDLSKLIPTFSCDGETTVNGKPQQSGVTANNYENGLYYNVNSGGKDYTYAVKLIKLRDKKLPNVYVRFDGSEVGGDNPGATINQVVWGTDKSLSVNCRFSVSLGEQSEIINAVNNEFTELDDVEATIKLRGNSTLHQPKKSWNIKLSKKSNVLDMPSNKSWILLADHLDKSLIRPYIASEMGLALDGLEFTGSTRYVNLFMNGRYNGVYLLIEKTKIGKNRVNIDSFEDSLKANPDSPNYTGGYIMELDSRQANYNGDEPKEVVFKGGDWWFIFKDPDDKILQGEVSDKAKAYMSDYMNKFREALNNPASGEYKKYIDVDSFIDWYLVNEVMKNLDAGGNTSIYCYKKADTIVGGKTVENGKLYMGPIWDFDLSSGNESNKNPEGWHIRGGFWYSRLFNDPEFEMAVEKRYTEWRNSGFDAKAIVNEAGAYLNDAAADNFERWDILNSQYGDEPDVLHVYSKYPEYLGEYLDGRLKWMDSQLLIK